jgi:hypothetical protein
MAKYFYLCIGEITHAQKIAGIKVVVQVSESDSEMNDQGVNIGAMMVACPDEVLYVFSNNQHFINGVMQACITGLIDHQAIVVQRYSGGFSVPITYSVNKKGDLVK